MVHRGVNLALPDSERRQRVRSLGVIRGVVKKTVGNDGVRHTVILP
jgi:hypothetical protein